MKSIFLISILIIIISSCKKELKFKLKDADIRLVVEGLITNEKKVQIIKLSKTSNYFSTQGAEKVSGAKVEISDGQTTVILNEVIPGIYQTDSTYQGQIGKIYTLTIDYNSEKYSANSILKPVLTIDSIYVIKQDSVPYNPLTGGSPATHAIIMYSKQQPNTDDCILFKGYVNGIDVTDTITKVRKIGSWYIAQNYYGDNIEVPIFNEFNTKIGDVVQLKAYSISYEYFLYLNKLPVQISVGDPFMGPPANYKGNIKNLTNPDKDVFGYFVTSAVSYSSAKVLE